MMEYYRPTWAEVDLKAVRHNLQEVQKLAGARTELLPVVKGDAYGHGIIEIALLLNGSQVNFFGVSDVAEGITLRRAGIKKSILLFESTLAEQAKLIAEYDLTPTICTHELAATLNRYAQLTGKKIDIHIDVDTGMGRLGVWHKDAEAFIERIVRENLNLTIKGIYTHFPSAESDRRFTQSQIEHLHQVVTRLDKKGVVVPYIHAANSMGIVGYKTKILNLARPGLMLYGLYPDDRLKKKIRLNPALSVKSKVMFVKDVVKGRSISYGRTFIAKKNMTVATLAIGYRDGYLRALSNKSSVLIDGKRCPVVGRVTMDQIMVDVSKVKTVRPGMEAVVLGRQGKEEISAEELATLAGTINYEIVCSLGNRLTRIYKNSI